MHLESSSEFKEVIAQLNNSESLDSFHRIMISTRPIVMGLLVESIKNTKHNVIALTINSIKLTGDEIKKLEDVFTHCASLESLDLSNNDLTSKEAEILAGILANNKTVKSLSLNNNKIGDNGLKAFAKIAENSSIKFLNFSDNNISDIGFKYWAETLKKNTSLTDFNFHNNKIHDEGIEALAEALPPNTSIKRFTIALEGLTNETRELLKKVVNDKAITVKQYPATKLLPDALDVWVEDRIPEPESQQPVKEIPVPALQPTETLALLDKYNSKFSSLLERGNKSAETPKALIILGNPGSGKTTLADLFVHKKLTIVQKGFTKLEILKDSNYSPLPEDNILLDAPIINIIKGDNNLIVCNSNCLQDKITQQKKTVNAFYMQKILSNYSTKFIVTIKDSELEKEFLPLTKNLATLLKNVTLSSDSLSLVITNSSAYRTKANISEDIGVIHYNYAPKLRSGNEEEKSLVRKELQIMSLLKTSTYIIPGFSPGELNLGKDLQAILSKPTVTNKDNKIAVGSADISDILTLQPYIKEGLKDGISKLSDKIKTKWEKEKASLFILGTQDIRDGCIVPPNTEALKKLQGIFEWLKKPGNDSSNNNIIDNDTAKFLALNNVLYNVLTDEESSELNVKLSSYIDYLKYFTAISVDNRNTNMHDNWFKMLADGVLSIGDINMQLVESFKTAMQNSFCCRLETFVKEFSSSTKVLTKDTISNIYSLKLLQSILVDEDIKKGINSFTVIEYILNITSPTGGIDLEAKLVEANITVLKELVIEHNLNYGPKILTEIWQEFVDLKAIKDINENIHIIYEKLITAEIPYKMDIKIYDKLLELIELKDVGSADLSNPHIKDCYPKLAEVYYKIGSGVFDGAELFESYNPPELMGTVGFA